MLQRLASLAHAIAHQQHQQLQHVLLPLLQLPQQVQQQQQQLAAQQRICTASYSTSSTLSSSLRSVMSRGGHLAACSSTCCFPASQPLHPAPLSSLWHATQQLAAYSQRLSKMNPKERKAQQVKDKKTLKKSAVPQGTASAGDSATSFEDDMQTVEADVTRLVLQAIHNITPVLDVRTVRSATTVKYVPGLMPPRKARSVALHWLVRAADARKKSSRASYAECLALELLLAYQKRGGARQKRDDLHKLALQNRANVHLRWW